MNTRELSVLRSSVDAVGPNGLKQGLDGRDPVNLSTPTAQKRTLPEGFLGDDVVSNSLTEKAEELRKKRKVIQRDMNRIMERYDALKESLFRDKMQLLEEEQRLLGAGTHPSLEISLDEIEKAKEFRFKVAETRLKMTKKCIQNHFDTDLYFVNSTFQSRKTEVRREMLNQLQSLYIGYLMQSEKVKFDDDFLDLSNNVQDNEEVIQWRHDLLPPSVNPLTKAEIYDDITSIKQA